MLPPSSDFDINVAVTYFERKHKNTNTNQICCFQYCPRRNPKQTLHNTYELNGVDEHHYSSVLTPSIVALPRLEKDGGMSKLPLSFAKIEQTELQSPASSIQQKRWSKAKKQLWPVYSSWYKKINIKNEKITLKSN